MERSSNLYYLYGTNYSFITNKIDDILTELKDMDKEINRVNLTGKELDDESLINVIKSQNLFGELNFIIIEFIEEAKKNIIKHLVDLIDDTDMSSHLCFTSGKEPVKSILEVIRKRGTVIQYKYPDFNDIRQLVDNMFKGKSFDVKQLREIFELTGNDIIKSKVEFDKIITYSGEGETPTNEELKGLTANIRCEENIYSITRCLNEGDLNKALKSYRDLLKNRENSFLILSIFILNLMRLYIVKKLMKRGTKKEEIAGKIGISTYFLDEYMKGSRIFEENILLKLINELLEIEYRAKSGLLDLEGALEDFMTNRYFSGGG